MNNNTVNNIAGTKSAKSKFNSFLKNKHHKWWLITFLICFVIFMIVIIIEWVHQANMYHDYIHYYNLYRYEYGDSQAQIIAREQVSVDYRVSGWLQSILTINFVLNNGIALNALSNLTFLIIILDILVIVGVIYFTFKEKRFIFAIPAAIIIAGALGNLGCRAFIGHGAVVDYLQFFNWPISCNVSDICVFSGIIVLICMYIYSFFVKGKEHSNSTGVNLRTQSFSDYIEKNKEFDGKKIMQDKRHKVKEDIITVEKDDVSKNNGKNDNSKKSKSS